jgi:hypothetical protein
MMGDLYLGLIGPELVRNAIRPAGYWPLVSIRTNVVAKAPAASEPPKAWKSCRAGTPSSG